MVMDKWRGVKTYHPEFIMWVMGHGPDMDDDMIMSITGWWCSLVCTHNVRVCWHILCIHSLNVWSAK